MQAGIVGLPNVGKSTLFNALTAAGAESANYPFCTIEPNIGVISVPDPRLARIQAYVHRQKTIPAVVEILDIAGLVRGASQGEGLGNRFLSHIRTVDAILHVVRCFDDAGITHVEGEVDPLRDIETLELELALADLESMERQLEKLRTRARTGDDEARTRVTLLDQGVALLESEKPLRAGDWSEEEHNILSQLGFLTIKPVLFVCNVDEASAQSGNAYTEKVREQAAKQGAGVVVISAQIEAELAELEPEDRVEMLAGLGIEETGLARLARAAYALLGLQTYFTIGEKEVRAWTIPVGATCPEAAGVIHTDFQRGFIRAQVFTLDDLETHSSEAEIRAAGKLRSEGKDYVVQDGDIIHFLFNV